MKRGEVWVANLNPPRGREARLGDGPLTTLSAAEMASVEPGLRLVLGMP